MPSFATSSTFLTMPNSWMIVVDLLGVAIAGGMFVVPLYAFLTTTVPKSETARTVAANNIVNSGLMVAATLRPDRCSQLGVTVADSLLMVAGATSSPPGWAGSSTWPAIERRVTCSAGNTVVNRKPARRSSRTALHRSSSVDDDFVRRADSGGVAPPSWRTRRTR